MEGSDPVGLDLHIQALKEWNNYLDQIIKIDDLDYESDDDKDIKTSKEVEFNKSKCLALCFIGNVSFINSVVDSSLFKALCISFFDKYYHLPQEPFMIFNFMIEKFKPSIDYLEPLLTPVKRGEYLFNLLRGFQLFTASYDLLTMIFVCVSRNYGTCSRIVSKYPNDFPLGESCKNQAIWCEFFDTKDSLWKCVDFSTPKFDHEVYKYNQTSIEFPSLSKLESEGIDEYQTDNDINTFNDSGTITTTTTNNNKNNNKVDKENSTKTGIFRNSVVNDREFGIETEFKELYKGYLYVQRENKIFIYSNLNKLTVRTIVVLPKYRYLLSRMLYVKEYPFEGLRKLENLKSSFSEKRNSPHRLIKSGSGKSPSKNVFILSCNIGGMISEITPKYVQKTNTFIKWFDELLVQLNQNRIRNYLSKDSKNRDSTKSDIDSNNLNTGNIEILNANLLENVDSKFINNLVSSFPIPTKKAHFVNHPMYILQSQIKRDSILKPNSVPVTNFGDDLVFLKNDLLEVKTRLGWYKENRQVKPNSKPVQVYNSSRNNKLEYYTKEQTELLKQANINDYGHSAVNLSGNRFVPEDSTYIKSQHYSIIEKICKRNRIFFKKSFSSFNYEDGSLKPKIDGIILMNKDLQSFLNLYKEHVEDVVSEELNDELSKSYKFWKQIFKTFLNSPPIHRSDSGTNIRKKLSNQVKKFLNQLI